MSAWLSVIVPTFNGERYIAECLGSIAQNDIAGDIEVIVIDDGSTDATCEIVRSFQPRLNLTLVEQAHTGNWTIGTNLGMSMATGKYTCWLHQDDCWEPHRSSTLRYLVTEFPEVGLFFDSSWFMSPDGQRIRRWTCPLPVNRRLDSSFVVPRLLIQCFVSSCAPVFSSKLARECGSLDQSLWLLSDWDYWLRLASLTACVNRSGPPSCSYRIHPEAQTLVRSKSSTDLNAQYATVQKNHGVPSTSRVAQFSSRANIRLFAGFHKRTRFRPILGLIGGFLTLWPHEQVTYLKYSRIVERLLARHDYVRTQSTTRLPSLQVNANQSEVLP